MKKKIITILFGCMAIIISLSSCNGANSNDESIAIERTKEFFIANFEGDVDKLKQNTTPEFYEENYLLRDDEQLKSMLLSVPSEKREKSKNEIKNNSTFKASQDGDVITVTCTNNTTGKQFIVELKNTDGNGNWLITDYIY